MGGAEGVPGRSQVAARGGHAGRCRGAVSGRCQRAASLAAPFRRAMAFWELGRWRWRRVAASWGGRSVRLSEARQEAYTRVPPEPVAHTRTRWSPARRFLEVASEAGPGGGGGPWRKRLSSQAASEYRGPPGPPRRRLGKMTPGSPRRAA